MPRCKSRLMLSEAHPSGSPQEVCQRNRSHQLISTPLLALQYQCDRFVIARGSPILQNGFDGGL